MSFTEQQLYDALGVGAKEPEVAEPAKAAQEPTEEGAREPETAEPAEEGTEAQEPTGAKAEPEETTPAGQQTEEQRREMAAQRRREEQKAAIDAAVQKARGEEQQRSKAEMDDFFSKAGLKNTITGEPIRNIEEFRSWKESYDAAKLQEDLKAGRLTPESLDAAIQKSPAVQKAEEILRRSEEAERAAEEAKAQAEINEQISEIGKLDPSIKTVRDLLTMPKAKEFYEYVKRGNNYLDAYYLATRGEREAKMAEAGRQQALANARSKDHLTASSTGRSDAQPSVSAEDMAMFRLFNPDCTEAQVQAYMKKKTGG